MVFDILPIIIYIIAISFQLSGSLLLIHGISTKRDDIILSCYKKTLFYRDADTKEIEYKHELFEEKYKQAYLNKIAFCYLCFGYFLGLFGIHKSDIVIYILILTLIFTVFLWFIAKLIVNNYLINSYYVKKKITNDELVRLGVEPDLESISDKEIEDMIPPPSPNPPTKTP